MMAMSNHESAHQIFPGRMWWHRWVVALIGVVLVVTPLLQLFVGQGGAPIGAVVVTVLFALGLLALSLEPLFRSIEVWFDVEAITIADRLGAYRLRTTHMRWDALESVNVGYSPLGWTRRIPLYHLHLQTRPGLLFDGGRRDFCFGRRLHIDETRLRELCLEIVGQLRVATGVQPDAPRVDVYSS